MLIPVLASGSKKKTARVCAYIVEVAAVLVLFAYLYAQLIAYTRFKTDGGTGFIWDYGVIGIALGGAALMLIVQSIAYKGRSGIMKLAMALLGAIAVFCLLDIPAIFNFTRTDVFGGNLYVGYYNDVDAITVLSNFFSQGLTFFGRTAANMFTGTVIAVLALLVIVNFAIDLIELSANTTKGGIIFDIVRYGAELVLLVIGIVMLFLLNVQDLSPGLLIGIIFLAALVQVILSSIRCGLYRKSGKERKVEPVNAPVPVQQFAYTAPAYTTPAPTPAPTPTPTPSSGSTITVTMNGVRQEMDLVECLAMIARNEMGANAPVEAYKAQMVAAHSWILSQGGAPSVAGREPNETIRAAAREVAGQILTYNGSVAFTPYFASAAFGTNSSQEVWGGARPYLINVDSPYDKDYASNWQSTRVYYTSEVAARAQERLGVDLYAYSSNPEDWFGDIVKNSSGYVTSIRVGTATTTGRNLRENVLNNVNGKTLRSAAFDISYDAGNEAFTFTVYGYGHGCGMSQMGAWGYAANGWGYADILAHYYPGTTLVTQ